MASPSRPIASRCEVLPGAQAFFAVLPILLVAC